GPTADAIEKAAREVREGRWDAEFPIDVFQSGSGTSLNMNANEVIANRAAEILGRRVHPNDQVNLGQSSNDVIPSVLHVSAVIEIERDLLVARESCVEGVRHLEADGALGGAGWESGALKTVAGSLMKIANGVRLMNSGPRCGLAEITLPAIQPGSSIMPGKVNPVICEAVIQ